jgi:mono/diheme cytochrome c family protein
MTMLVKSLVIVIVAASFFIGGCGQNAQPSGGAATQASADIHEKAGAELWAENCSRCHNIRPPQSFSDAQWETIVHHMRLRADLTGQEARKITEFLKASH